MDTHPTCPRCGATLPGGSHGSACPACLFQMALDPSPPCPPDPPVPEPGDIQPWFPDLEILKILGRGGMGLVYLVRQPSLDRLAALKILPIALGARQGFRDRFLREARTLAALVHPNIVTIHDFGERGGYFFFLMEYVGGGDLASILAAGALSPESALALVPPLCEALQYAHDRGVIHRDIKPANILLDSEGRVKIADFGVAKLMDKPGQDGVPADYLLGTPAYMAPEQKDQSLAVDHRADIFSLGVLIHELLTGIHPAGKDTGNGNYDPRARRLEAVVKRALAENPDARYQKVSDLSRDIQDAISPARRRGLNIATGLAVAALVLAMAWVLARRDDEPKGDGLPVVWVNSLGMPFRPLPGSTNLLCIRETSQADFALCAKDLGWDSSSLGMLSRDPVTKRTAEEADAFCHWLTRRDRAAGKLAAHESYRLPTDAEWSAAAGLEEPAGELPFTLHLRDKTRYPWGQTTPAPAGAGNYPDTALAKRWPNSRTIPSYYDGYPFVSPVASFPPDANGFHDLGGNVWELTRTPGPDGNMITAWRGGSWNAGAKDGNWDMLLLSWRMKDTEGLATERGFRVLLDRQSSPPVSLLAAIRAGDHAAIQDLLTRKSGLNDKDIQGTTPLLAAAAEADTEVLQWLLAAGADVSQRDKNGQSALHFAARRGDEEAVRLLLDKGIKADVTNRFQMQPIHAAAEAGHTAIIALLVQTGANPLAPDAFGQNAVSKAAVHGREETLLWLLDHGGVASDPQSRLATALNLAIAGNHYGTCAILLNRGVKVLDASGECPALVIAACLGHDEIFSLLISRVKGRLPESLLHAVGTSYLQGLTKMGESGISGIDMQNLVMNLESGEVIKAGDKAAIIRTLVERGVPLEHRDQSEFTPLLTAAYHGEIQVVRTLLDLGADITAVDKEGFSALHSAAEWNHPDVVDFLLAAGAEARLLTKDGRTALGLAVGRGHRSVADLLLRTGSDPDEISGGMTPLSLAALLGDKDMIALLLAKGANPAKPTQHQQTPLALASGGPGGAKKADAPPAAAILTAKPGIPTTSNATDEDYRQCLMLLLDAGAPVNPTAPAVFSPLHFAATFDFEAGARLLMEKGATVDFPGPMGATPLAMASSSNALKVARLLLEKSARTSPSLGMESPLHQAARNGHAEMVTLLLDHGANPNVLDGKSASPLHWAIVAGHEKVVGILVKRGADLKARDFVYNTPLHLAAAYPGPEVVRALLEAGADPLARNLEGATPLQIADFKKLTMHLEMLRSAEARARAKP